MFEIKYKMNDKPLRELQKLLDRGGDGGPLRDMFTQWGRRYLTFVRRRFVRFSRGGGGWEPLAESTKRGRRGPKRRKTRSGRARAKTTTRGSGRRFAILRDTGTLFNALSPGAPGNLLDVMKEGVRVGFSGRHRHPKGKATIADIAEFHQAGGKHLPKREILVEPDERLARSMYRDATRAVQKMLAQAEQRGGGL